MEPSIEKALDAVKAGTFTAEDYWPLSNLAVGGCTLAPLDASLVPAEVIELVWAREAEIRSGARKVAIDDSEPKSSE
jgi:basic membrane lipoprotein Med (substrate-binding protein (PBP1-ABC) superfamily)